MHQRSGGKEDLGIKTLVLFAGEEKNDLASWSSGSLSVPAEVKKLRADAALLVPTNLLAPRVAIYRKKTGSSDSYRTVDLARSY